MVGKAGIAEGSRMMRKLFPIMLGAALGAGLVVFATRSPVFSEATARAAASDT
jgi:hypothetical protein